MTRAIKNYNEIAGQRVQRIEALSDGVIAIAITLLVLELHVPVTEAIHSEGDVLASFLSLAPKFLAYFLSFMTLGIFWVGHTAQYHVIEKSDRNLTWLNLFFLLFVTVVPFTTAFLGEHLDSRVAVVIYWLNLLALGLTLFLHWRYAYRHDFLTLQGDERQIVDRAVRGRILVAQSLYAAGMLLCFISTWLSIGVIVLIQLNYALGVFPRHRN